MLSRFTFVGRTKVNTWKVDPTKVSAVAQSEEVLQNSTVLQSACEEKFPDIIFNLTRILFPRFSSFFQTFS